jgi:hypothetical protein
LFHVGSPSVAHINQEYNIYNKEMQSGESEDPDPPPIAKYRVALAGLPMSGVWISGRVRERIEFHKADAELRNFLIVRNVSGVGHS